MGKEWQQRYHCLIVDAFQCTALQGIISHSFMILFIHLFNKYLLSARLISPTGCKSVNKTAMISVVMKHTITEDILTIRLTYLRTKKSFSVIPSRKPDMEEGQ